MLVKAKDDHKAYGDITRINRGGLYVVYAISHQSSGDEYSVLPAGKVLHDYDEPDPLFFPAEFFDVVVDRVSGEWDVQSVHTAAGAIKYSSFPEWFEQGFYIRARDWSLEGDDYKVVRKYKEKYEDVYKDLIKT